MTSLPLVILVFGLSYLCDPRDPWFNRVFRTFRG
jgi:hypothetical protein